MKIIVTIVPTNLVTKLLLSLFCPASQKKKFESNIQQVGVLVTTNISAFC